jgi:hypothetical protein
MVKSGLQVAIGQQPDLRGQISGSPGSVGVYLGRWGVPPSAADGER